MTALVDTNILVYRFDPRFPEKHRAATALLRKEIASDSISCASPGDHRICCRGRSATSRLGSAPYGRGCSPRSGRDAGQFSVLYPNEQIVRTALRGAAAYQLPWFDAHLWAYADYYGLSELISEDFEHGRLYRSVRAVNPFRPS